VVRVTQYLGNVQSKDNDQRLSIKKHLLVLSLSVYWHFRIILHSWKLLIFNDGVSKSTDCNIINEVAHVVENRYKKDLQKMHVYLTSLPLSKLLTCSITKLVANISYNTSI